MIDDPAATEGCPTRVYSRPCGKKIKRRGHCGVHANVLDRDDQRNAEYAARRARYQATKERVGVATNLVGMLADMGVTAMVDENQGQVILTNGAAEQLLHRLQGGA